MLGIFELNCKKALYELDEDAKEEVYNYLKEVEPMASDFGNARGVRNIFEKLLIEQANRIAELETVSKEDLLRITKSDVLAALYEEDGSDDEAENPNNTETTEEDDKDDDKSGID